MAVMNLLLCMPEGRGVSECWTTWRLKIGACRLGLSNSVDGSQRQASFGSGFDDCGWLLTGQVLYPSWGWVEG